MPTMNELKKDSIVADEPPKAEFEKLTCSENDYESKYGDYWVTNKPKYKV